MNPALWNLQHAENTLSALSREKARLDDGTGARAARDTLEKAVAQEAERAQKLASQRQARELELQSAEEKLARQQSRLMSAHSAHEISALERDIQALTKARGDLDEAILTLMDECESSAQKVADLEAQLKSARAQTIEVEKLFKMHTQRLESALEVAQTERQKARAALSPGEKKQWDLVAQTHGGVAVARAEKGNCSVCGTAILPGNLRDAKTQEFPTCDGCGRLLWVES